MPMMNSHILTQEFALHRAGSVREAVALLERYNGRAKVLAGGTDLLVNMKLERACPSKIVYIGRIEALRHIRHGDDGLSLGGLATFYDVQESKVIRDKYPALSEASRSVSGTQIKVMGSIGGNLCNASPAADLAPPLLVFNAQVELMSNKGSRQVAVTDFFLGPGRTVVEPAELLTAISLGPPDASEGSAFVKLGRVGADIAKVSVAARVVREGERIVDCKIALGSVAATPLRAYQAEGRLIGETFGPRLVEEASQLAAKEIKPITDVRSTAQYRMQAAQVLVRDAVARAWDRSSTGDP